MLHNTQAWYRLTLALHQAWHYTSQVSVCHKWAARVLSMPCMLWGYHIPYIHTINVSVESLQERPILLIFKVLSLIQKTGSRVLFSDGRSKICFQFTRNGQDDMRGQYARVKSFVFFYLLREKCLVFEPRMKGKKPVCKCECEVRSNIVFEHISTTFLAP